MLILPHGQHAHTQMVSIRLGDALNLYFLFKMSTMGASGWAKKSYSFMREPNINRHESIHL